ncbi:orotidine-5'-phosphate decarboxylase [Candidatus Woesearchaeota archaeon]|nr:orotidine-5'-phosphate decarboxylase [Candidatus Woesearchaeota archaeon]
METKDKICLALDVDSAEKARALVKELHDYVGVFKINSLFNEAGPKIVKEIVDNGGKVFLDLKYHDIPNTVANYAKAATKMGVFMFNIHATGGLEMMKAAAEAVKETAESLDIKKPIVLGVTVLTSIDQDALNSELNVSGEVEAQVIHLALLAKKAGLDGVVCSPKEIKAIREACGNDFVIVTPGIRPAWSATDDQKRITTPKDAVEAGADYLVIGRPIRNADDKVEAAKKILEEIS